MKASLSAISNLYIPPKARRLKHIQEFIACILCEYVLSGQCSSDVSDSIYSAISRYFSGGEVTTKVLIGKLLSIEDAAELYEQFPAIEKDDTYDFSAWSDFMNESEWQIDDDKSKLTLNGMTYEMATQVLILGDDRNTGELFAKRFRIDSQGNANYVRIGTGDDPIPAPIPQLFSETHPKEESNSNTAVLEINEEEFFELSDTVKLADEQQREAITSDVDKNLVILAGAGSGKTRTLVCRLAYLHLVREIPLNEILLLTFTTSAANEMRRRSVELIEPIYAKFSPLKKANVNARTIDSFVVSLIDTYYAHMGFTQKPVKCLDGSEEIERERLHMLETVIKENQLVGVFRYYFDDADNAKENFRWLLDNLMLYACGLPINCAGFDTLCQLYLDKQRECNKVMGFTEASLLVRDAINQPNSAVKKAILSRYSCILIDEFQDINMLQNSIFEPFYNSLIHFTFVGDDDQSIYFWRGSDNSIIKSFLHKKNTKATFLLINYRNNPNIVEAGNAILDTIKDRAKKDKPIRPHRKTGAKIRIATYDNKYTNLVNEISNLLKSEQPLEEICILSRNREEGRKIGRELIAADIPVAKERVRVDVNDNYKLLKAIINILNSNNITASIKEIIRITKSEKVTERHVQKVVLGKCDKADCEENLLAVKSLGDELRQNIITDLADAVYRYSIKAGELFENIINDRHSDGVFEAFEDFCKNNSVPWPVPQEQLKELFKAFEDDTRKENRQGGPLSNGVRISTIHSAKGLEYNVVIITGLAENYYPSTEQIDRTYAARNAQLHTFNESRETYYSLRTSIDPNLHTELLRECDNPAFSQREKDAMEEFQAELYNMKEKVLSLSADGVNDYLDAYRYFVEPIEAQYSANICEQSKALLIDKTKIESLKEEISLLMQEDLQTAAEKQNELDSLQANADDIEATVERLNHKRNRFFRSICKLKDFNTTCLTASGLLADMEKAEEIGTLQEQFKEEREQRINEERRLFYVAVTRARDFLYLCREAGTTPSEFMRIIPDALKEDRIMLTREEEQEYARLADALHKETSKAFVNDEKVEKQTEKLLSQDKFSQYIHKRSEEFNLDHPVFAMLSPAEKSYYDKAVGLLFISELTGGEFKTEFAHNMQRMAEMVLQEISGKGACPFKSCDVERTDKIIDDIRSIAQKCITSRPASKYLIKLLTEPDRFSDNLKTLKSAGIMHYIIRSERYEVEPSIRDTWKTVPPLKDPKAFLLATLDLSSMRNALIHRDSKNWPDDPVPVIISNAEIIVQECCAPKQKTAAETTNKRADSAVNGITTQPLTQGYISIGTKVRHFQFGRGAIVSVLNDTFTVDFNGTRKAFLKSSASRVFIVL